MLCLPGCLRDSLQTGAVDRDRIFPSESILQRCSQVMEWAEEEQLAGLLFCPLEEALLDYAALPNSTWKEPLGRSQGEKCQFCAVVLFHPSPSSASSVLQAVVLSVRVSPAWNSLSDGSSFLNPLPGRCFLQNLFSIQPSGMWFPESLWIAADTQVSSSGSSAG